MTQFHDAFISYGRADSLTFATALNERLLAAGLDIWFDFDDIPKGVDYQKQIDDGIDHAHNFLFVISPHSVNSPYCGKEIALAIARGKRIIPLLHVEKISRDTWQQRFPDGTDADWVAYTNKGLHSSYPNMHPVISKINWVYVREGQDDLEVALATMQTIFERQRAYVECHTWILNRALYWQRNQRRSRFLLTGDERLQAQTWLGTEFKQEQAPCLPTDLHTEYIAESQKNANNWMTDVFLAYAETDQALMEQVRSQLWQAGLTVWINTTDIKSGEDINHAIARGIETASSVVVLLSASSIADARCQQAWEYAQTLHKRIIPLLVEANVPAQLPPGLQDLPLISLPGTGEAAGWQFPLLQQLHQNADYHTTHKHLLVKALKWQRQNRNPSILLRGYNLRQGEAWLKLAQSRPYHPATSLQVEFIEESLRQPPATSLDVFISYSRTDSGLARRLNDALQVQGKTTWFDQESIAAGSADFQREIYDGIEVSDNFVFILSPAAIASPYCDDEVTYAAKLNKRFITILSQSIDPTGLHPELAKVQWIDFTATAAGDFNTFFAQLIRVLETDRDHVHSHTKWLQRSLDWDEKDRSEDLLLRGTELAIAQSWLQEAQKLTKRPAPTQLQQDFIQASQGLSERLEQAAEAQHQRELEQARQLAQAAEAQRQAETEARHQAEQRAEQEAKARRISQRITLITGIGAPLLSMLALITSMTWRASQVDKIETLAIAAETHLRDQQPFDALVNSTLATLRLKQMWLFPPQHLRGRIDGALRQAEQDVRERNRLEGDAPFLDVELSPDERYLALATQKGRVMLWDIEQQREHLSWQAAEQAVYQVYFTPDGLSLLTTGEEQPLQRWDLQGKLQQTFDLSGPSPTLVSVSPDGQWIAATNATEGKVWLLSKEGIISHELATQGESLAELHFSPDGQLLVGAGFDRHVYLWQRNGTLVQRYVHDDAVLAADFSPDGQSLITASWDQTLRQWDLAGNEQRHWQLAGKVFDMDSSKDGTAIAIAYEDGHVVNLDLATGSQNILQGHTDAVNEVQISAKHQLIVSASSDRTMRLWEYSQVPKPAIAIPTDATILDLRLDQQNGYLVAKHSDNTTKLWDLNQKLIASLPLDGEVRAVSFNPLKDEFATSTAEGTVTLWNLQGQRLQEFNAHPDQVMGLAFSADGQHLATASSDSTAAIWDLQGNRQATLAGHADWVNHVTFAPDASRLVTTSLDRKTRIWSTAGTLQQELTGHDDWVETATFSADGQVLATASRDRRVILWQSDTGQVITQLNGHQGAVTDVAFIEGTDLLVTTSEDGTARLWNFAGDELTQYKLHNAAIQFVKVSRDGQFLATIADNGSARLWQIDVLDNLLIAACQRLKPYLSNNQNLDWSDRRRCNSLVAKADSLP